MRREAIAVLDVGHDRVALFAVAPDGHVLASRAAPNVVDPEPPYPHVDVDHLWRWLMAALGDLGERYAVLALIPVTHGAAAALVDADGLVLPIMDRSAVPPPGVTAAYAGVAPWFEECFCPLGPGATTLALQLFWQSRAFVEAFARARWILPYPQYWAWRLAGVAACEVTSLGAQTQLWSPRERRLSRIAETEGWGERLPMLRDAWSVLGPITGEVAARTRLPGDTPVLCGIHADGARQARHIAAALENVATIRGGASLRAVHPELPLGALDPFRDMAACSDLEGRPVAGARFAAAEEAAGVLGGASSEADPGPDEVAALLEAGSMAVPAFAASGGPFPGAAGRGHILGPPPATPQARAALAALYVALMADAVLDLLRAPARVVVEGPRAEDGLFCALLAALRPGCQVLAAREPETAAIGAALLWQWRTREAPVRLDLEPVPAVRIPGLGAYARRWRALAEAPA